MPKHVRSIQCCYCGASALLDLAKPSSKSLKCRECGAGMAVTKMAHVFEPPDAAGWNGEIPPRPVQKPDPAGERRLAEQWQGKQDWRGDDRHERPKPKKKKGFFDRLEDIWDEVEDIFD